MERELREPFVEDEMGAFREHDIVSTINFDPTIDPFKLCEPSSMGVEEAFPHIHHDVPIREPFSADNPMEEVSAQAAECNDSEGGSDGAADNDDGDVIDMDIPDINIDDELDQLFGEPHYIPMLDMEGDMDAKLYGGSSLSPSQAVSLLLSWFSSFPGISKQALSSLLNLLHTHILPPGNILPSSYKLAVKLLRPYLSPVKEYHYCINDCIMFRDYCVGKYSQLTSCPICGEPRFKSDNKSPRKRFKFLSVATRITRFFGTYQTSILLKGHGQSEAGTVAGIHGSPAWKEWYGKDGIFGGDTRAISFALCADGLNPFAHEKTKYSMCPLFLIPLNLPDHIRKKSGSMFLTGIIPGRYEPKNMDPYVDLIVDDIMALNSMTAYDAHSGERFRLKANILLHVFDYPGQNKIFKSQGSGAYSGCTYCCVKGEYSNNLQKIVYLDHRVFLPSIDVLHGDNRGFPSATHKKRPAPKTMEFVNKANGEVAAASTDAERKRVYQSTGCKGPYSLSRLPNHDRYLNTPVEPMHVIKNVSEHIVKLLSGIEDSVKVRREEQQRKRFKRAWVKSGHTNEPLPSAPFTLSQEEMAVGNKRALSIYVPTGMDWKRRKLFDRKSLGYVKSIEWKHVLCSGILKYCIRGLLGEQQRTTLFELCDVLAALLDYGIAEGDIDSLEYRLHRVLSLLERDFPVSLHVIVFHLLHHLPMFIHRFGPAYSFWMYPMERFNSWIAARITNRRHPETTVLESYRLFELSSFLQLSGKLPQDAAADLTDIYQPSEESVSVRSSQCTLLNEEQLFHLEIFYRMVDSDYKALLSAYEKDKDHASCTEDFPPLSCWQPENTQSLSPCQLQLCQGPSKSIVALPVYVKQDEHGRKVKYSTATADDPASSFTSSYVALKAFTTDERATHHVVFGRIQMIVKHCFNQCERVLAYVHWFDRPQRDVESGLYTVNLNSFASVHRVVSLTDLSRPIAHAVDCDDPNKLWLLNFK